MANDEKQPLFDHRLRERFFSQRVLVLDGVLDDDNGTVLATQLLSLASEDPRKDIALWIHSPGGSVPAMLAIRDVMRLVPCDVATLALGLACSAGQFLLSAGTPGKRFALAARPDPDAPGLGGHRRVGRRGGGAGGRSAAHPGHGARDHRRGHRAGRSSGSSPTRCTTAGSPPNRHASTASSTTSWTASTRWCRCAPTRWGSARRRERPHEHATPSQRHHARSRAASGSWTSTRTCSRSGSSTSARRSTPAWPTR